MSDSASNGDEHNLFAALSSEERHIAESLLKAAPNYSYCRSFWPPLDPRPAPGAAQLQPQRRRRR
jgi:hypothetical protein